MTEPKDMSNGKLAYAMEVHAAANPGVTEPMRSYLYQAAARLRATDWRTDMENAPRDGSSFLAYESFGYGDFRIFTVRWDVGDKECWRSDVHSFVEFSPTHWQHLPPPPE